MNTPHLIAWLLAAALAIPAWASAQDDASGGARASGTRLDVVKPSADVMVFNRRIISFRIAYASGPAGKTRDAPAGPHQSAGAALTARKAR